MPAQPVRVLVVEPDSTLRADVLDALTHAGFDARVAANLAMARQATALHCDAILLDVALPDGTGLQLCQELRSEGRAVPIIMMSAEDRPDDRVAGFEAGADDYVVKPYYMPELVARLKSILRRSGKSGLGSFIRHLDLWLDTDQVVAGREDETFKLKPREFSLLSFLIRNPGRAWTRKQLLDQVWGHEYAGDARTVDLHVRRLRAKIEGSEESPRYLETVWGVGYRMATELKADELTPTPPPSDPPTRKLETPDEPPVAEAQRVKAEAPTE